MTSSKSLQLTPIKQLVDLNEDMINYHIRFSIETEQPGAKFQVAVISQTTLDAGTPIDFQQVEDGGISGEISADKGIYLNYFLVLRTDEKFAVPVTVNIVREELAEQPSSDQQQPSVNDSSGGSMKNMMIVVVLILIGIYALYRYSSSFPKSSDSSPIVADIVESLPPPPSSGNVVATEPVSLLEKIRKVKV